MKLREPFTCFVDRSLGRGLVVEALRTAKLDVHAHADHSAHDTPLSRANIACTCLRRPRATPIRRAGNTRFSSNVAVSLLALVVALPLLTLRRLRRVEPRQLGAASALRLATVDRHQRAAGLRRWHEVPGSRRLPVGDVEGADR